MVAVPATGQVQDLIDADPQNTSCPVESVVCVPQQTVVLSHFGADVNGQRLERTNFTLQLVLSADVMGNFNDIF